MSVILGFGLFALGLVVGIMSHNDGFVEVVGEVSSIVAALGLAVAAVCAVAWLALSAIQWLSA